jgi:hypothetical protein
MIEWIEREFNMFEFQGFSDEEAFLPFVDPRNLVARCGEAFFYYGDDGRICFLTDGVKLFAETRK